MRILLVSAGILQAPLQALGHEVRTIYPDPGVLPLAKLVGDFEPHVLIQQESLGPRTILLGLAQAPCPTIFWSVDGHLNLFWHRHYARLFHAALFTQPDVAAAMGPHGPPASWLPWFGRQQAFVPHAQRSTAMGFVGRVTPERPARGWFVDQLRPLGLVNQEGVAATELPDWYAQTRIAPNEAILGEINFRLFEAASAGCAVLTPAFTPAQAGLFAPGTELLEYSDVLELEDKSRFLLRRPDVAEAMGRAAWERVNRDHLPLHRAKAVLRLLDTLPQRSVTDDGLAAAELMTLAQLRRDGRFTMPLEPLLQRLATLPEPACLAMRIRLLAEEGRLGEALGLATAAASQPAMPETNGAADDPHTTADGRGEPNGRTAVLLAGSMAALRAGDAPLARHLLALHNRASPRPGRQPAPVQAAAPKDILSAWSRELSRQGAALAPVFPFDHQRHLPATAVDCLLEAQRLAPEDLEITRRLDQLLEGRPGYEPTRLGLLSLLSLHRRQDWRLALRLAKVNLQAFRRAEGLAELEEAGHMARKQGEEAACLRMRGMLGLGPDT